MIEILYQDKDLIIVNKPSGIMVHNSPITEDTVFLLQLVRDQIKQRVYPIHRLDRGTSGVLAFGKTRAEAARIQELIKQGQIKKKYLAIVRGFVEEQFSIDYPLLNPKKNIKQEAVSHIIRLSQSELPFRVNRYPTSRYSLVQVQTDTGRFHQIRRHLAHLRHPVIGDKKHGDCKHNKYFKERLNLDQLMLHAESLELTTSEGKSIHILASLSKHFISLSRYLKLDLPD